MKSATTNWKTLIGGMIALSGVIGLLLHKLDLTTATTLIGTGATWVGVVGKDSDQGNTSTPGPAGPRGVPGPAGPAGPQGPSLQ